MPESELYRDLSESTNAVQCQQTDQDATSKTILDLYYTEDSTKSQLRFSRKQLKIQQ